VAIVANNLGARVDLQIREDFGLPLEIQFFSDEAQTTPQDITTWSLAGGVYDSAGALVFALTVTVVSAVNGEVDCTITNVQSALLTPGNSYFWRLTNGTSYGLFYGGVFVTDPLQM